MTKILNYFNKFELTLIIAMIFTNWITGGLSEPIGAICSITGVLAVVLIAKGKISNFAFGIINVSLYIYLSFTWKLYGDVMLGLLYTLPVQFIGFFTWKNRMGKNGVVKAKTMNGKQIGLLLVGSVTLISLYAQFLVYLGGNSPYLDASSTILSIVAQVLMLLAFAEQWALWIIVNSISIIMWIIPASTGDSSAISMVVMWTAYLINAIYGYYNWRRMAKA